MIDFSQVTAIVLGSDDVIEIQDSVGTVLWQKIIYYNVNISAGSNGTVSVNGVSGDYSQSVPSGTVLTIEGTGNSGYNFDEWSDGNTDNPRTITVTGDLTLTASFESAVLPSYFYLEDISGSANTVKIKKTSDTAPTIEVFKSTDGQNWSSMGSTSTTPITVTVPSNSKVYLKCTTNNWAISRFNQSNIITASGSYRIGGKIMSLLKGDNYEGTTFDSNNIYAFCRLFTNDTYLVDASNLILPTNTVDYCYTYLFLDCTSLVTGPVLPATTLAQSCYSSMFYGCTSLAKVTTYAQDISASSCLYNWLGNVAATGDFYNLGGATYTSGASGIPTGWTEHTSL